MNLHRKVNEALEEPVPFKITVSNKKRFIAEFTVNDRLIQFYAGVESSGSEDEPSSIWEVVFSEPEHGYKAFGITGSGGEFKVFATIKAILERMLSTRKDIAEVNFSADKDEKSRVKLYSRLLKRFIPDGFEFKEDHSSSDMNSYFTISRK